MWLVVVTLIACLLNDIRGQREEPKTAEKWCDIYTTMLTFGDMEFALNSSSLRNRIVAFQMKAIDNWSLQLNLTKCAMKDKNGLTNCVHLGIDVASSKSLKINVTRVWRQSQITGDTLERTHPLLSNASINQNQLVITLSNINGDVPTLKINDIEVEINDLFYCKSCVSKSLNLRGTNVLLGQICSEPDQAALTYPEYHRLMLEETDSRGQQKSDKSYRYGVYGRFTRQRSMTFFGRTTHRLWNVKVKLLVCVAKDERKLTDCRFVGFQLYNSQNNTKEINYASWKQDPISGKITVIISSKTPPIFDSTQYGFLLQLRNLDNRIQATFSGISLIRFNDFTNEKNYVIQLMNLQTEKYKPISSYYERSDTDPDIIKLRLNQCKNIKQSTYDKSYQVVGMDNFPPNRKLIFHGTTVTNSWSLMLILRACSWKDGKYVDCFSIVFTIANDPYTKNIEYRASKGDHEANILEGTIYRKIRFDNPTNELMIRISNAHNILQVSLNNIDIPWINFTYHKNRSIIHVTLNVDQYRLNKLCYQNETENLEKIFDFHQMHIWQSEVINQATANQSFRFETDNAFVPDYSMVFEGRKTDNNWLYKLNLSVCAIEIEFIDCFFLILSARPSKSSEGVLKYDVWRESRTGDILRQVGESFHGAIEMNNALVRVEVLHVNDAIRVAYNGLEVGMSGPIYCRNCVIQFVDVKVVQYQLAKASFHAKNGRLRLPTTGLSIGQCSYKNTQKSIKDISLQASSYVRNDNLTYYGSVVQNSWYFEVLMFQLRRSSTLLLHIDAHDRKAAVFSSLEYTDANGFTTLQGQSVIQFQSQNVDGFRPIEVAIKYEGRDNGTYQFFINGRDSTLSFDGNAFNRVQVRTYDAYVDKVCFSMK